MQPANNEYSKWDKLNKEFDEALEIAQSGGYFKSKAEKNIEFKESEVFKNIVKESEPYFGTLVLDMFEVVLLVGVDADEHDYYYVYQPAKGGGWDKDGKEYWSSCVGSYYPLKGVLPNKQYERLVWLWNNNYNEGIAK